MDKKQLKIIEIKKEIKQFDIELSRLFKKIRRRESKIKELEGEIEWDIKNKKVKKYAKECNKWRKEKMQTSFNIWHVKKYTKTNKNN